MNYQTDCFDLKIFTKTDEDKENVKTNYPYQKVGII